MKPAERRKGIALVESEKGILVVREKGNTHYSLPGGKADRGETRQKAAMRELQEETGLKAISSRYLHSYQGKPFRSHRGNMIQNHAKIFVVEAFGEPKVNSHEIEDVKWWHPGCDVLISGGTHMIIDQFNAFKESQGSTVKKNWNDDQ